MRPNARLALRGAAILVFCSFAIVAASAAHAASDDACALLTPAQVGAAFGSSVGAGEYVTPTFKKTCTWKASDAAKGYVTLNLQDVASFNGGKQLAQMSKAVVLTAVSGVGDDAYYLAVGKNVGLIVKKSNVAFKVAVYSSQFSMDKTESVEKALALQVLSKL